MRVVEHLEKAAEPPISFEIIPPLRGGNVNPLMDLIEDLSKYNPPFIDITSHGSQVIYEETTDGIKRKVKRKRPGTIGICALIQNKYNIDAVPHVLCIGFAREETEDFLIELNYLGIDNVLAIRGDENGFKKPLQYGRTSNDFATDLVGQIASMNQGTYLEEGLLDAEPTEFCVGIAGYPEKHYQAPNMATDIRHTKEKVDAGGEYIVTQMFFDNRHYFEYVDSCRAAGIEVPIIPGIKILTTKKQLSLIPSKFYCELPSELADEVEEAKPEQVVDIGVEWAYQQAVDLLDKGVPSLHFYLMQSSKAIKKLMAKLKP
jgi:methylenetetrahydrofolate reductase (NADPH)